MTGKSRDPKPTEQQDETVEEPEAQTFDIPADLTTLSDADLGSLTEQTREAVKLLSENGEPTADDLATITDLNAGLKALNSETQRRDAEKADLKARYEAQVAEALGTDAASGDAGDGGGANETPDSGDGDENEGGGDSDGDDDGQVEGTTASAPAHRPITVTMPRRPTLNPSLEDIAAQRRSDGYRTGLEEQAELVVTAAAEVPHLAPGQRLPHVDDLVEACIAKAKSLGVTNGAPALTPLASINRQFNLTLDATVHPDQVRTQFEELVRQLGGTGRAGMEALVAAGGWCAPSEIRYDFFRISEVAGQWDVPTFGVNRGGIRWPQSLSLAQFFALSGAPASGISSNATMPFEWTEADDIAATGASPSKTCLRPPCPSFDEQRLRAFGICVLAGNLTADAFPELIRHFIAQVVVAHARVINRRLLALAVAASTATTPAGTNTESPTAHILGGYELNAVDYRERHGMSPDAVLEGVLPTWALGLMRSDIFKRNGSSARDANAADAEIRDYFDTRNIRMQWVQDWQTRDVAGGIANAPGTIPTNWPTSVLGLLYAPGTFGRGNGMRLDLGVVRDSVLNADNDHTAAWSEEATLLAMFGHESRVITFDDLVANGHSGQQTAMTGP